MATVREGVQFLDAGTGELGTHIFEPDAQGTWRNMAVGVFPDRAVEGGETGVRHQGVP